MMMIILLSFLIGVIAGLRAMMAPAAVSWAAHLGLIDLGGSWLAFLGYRFTPWVFTLAAAAELVTDQLPSTPSRKVPPQFGARIVMGGMCGAAIGTPSGSWIAGLVAGVIGAVVGTLGGADIRGRIAKAFASDRPAALIEDVVAIAGAYAILRML
jgi:uncharacterized membrane protein